jgi:hypothetical protein
MMLVVAARLFISQEVHTGFDRQQNASALEDRTSLRRVTAPAHLILNAHRDVARLVWQING